MMTSDTAAKKKWRYGRVGAVVASFDFFVGVSAGLIFSLVFAFSEAARSNQVLILMGSAGVAAAIVTLVVGNLTLLLSLLTGEYVNYIKKMPSGTDGVVRPFLIVIIVGASGVITSMVGAMITPWVYGGLVVHKFKLLGTVETWHLLSWLVSFPGISCCFWSILGCYQLVKQLIFHLNNRERAEQILAKRMSLTNKTAV